MKSLFLCFLLNVDSTRIYMCACRGRGGTSTVKKGNDTGRRRRNLPQRHHSFKRNERSEYVWKATCFDEWWFYSNSFILLLLTLYSPTPTPHPEEYLLLSLRSLLLLKRNPLRLLLLLCGNCGNAHNQGWGKRPEWGASVQGGRKDSWKEYSMRRSVCSAAASKLSIMSRASAICYHK